MEHLAVGMILQKHLRQVAIPEILKDSFFLQLFYAVQLPTWNYVSIHLNG